jgi:3-oxoacyl-[acyl-carrier protein] reductase
MSKVLEGKVAVVTGSGQGIGRAIALAMAQEGAKVVTNNRKPGSTGEAMLTDAQVAALGKEETAFKDKMSQASGDAETTAQAIREAGGEAVAFFGDISDFMVAGKLIQTAIDSFGKIDILVNVAGAFGFSPIEKMSEELWDKVTLVKPKGYFNTIRHAVPHMIKQKWGRIINCTSKAWNGDIIRHAEYCAANAGVVGLTKAVAIELYSRGITCNAFSPFARTRASYELDAAAAVMKGEDAVFVVNRYTGEGKPMMLADFTPTPEYIAPFLCYLASEAGKDISGTVFSLGGNSIGMYSEPEINKSIMKFDDTPWTVEEISQQVPRGLFMGYRSPAADPY